jgi:RNA polymerase sigma factor (sigma-70 family)
VNDEAITAVSPGESHDPQAGPDGPDQRRGSAGGADWGELYERLYRQLWRPARTMVRRAFGSAFGDAEIEDLYGNAWLGTLRALDGRRDELTELELRKYVLTAVANQASKELRRRGRRPTAPLELARGVADGGVGPDERAAAREESSIARELLATLPARRRAVLLFRYGWGLEPREVCALVKGLSHRAYRKEITRGIDEISSKLRLVEQGRWCDGREPVLKAYVAGVADEEQRRQAEHHLAHCRHCADYVGKLNGHLHELAGSVAWTGVADAVGGDRAPIAGRIAESAERIRDAALGVVNRGGGESTETVTQAGAAGGTRGAGIGAAGGLAKIAGLGAAPKLVVACLGTGAAATACVATGVAPLQLSAPADGRDSERATLERSERHPAALRYTTLPSQVGHEAPVAPSRPSPSRPAETGFTPSDPAPTPVAPAPAPAPAPPVQQEFGLAAPSEGDSGYTDSSGSTGIESPTTGAGGGTVTKEFGP